MIIIVIDSFVLKQPYLQINPSRKQPVTHNEVDLIVARESRWQDDLDVRGEYSSGVDYCAILILNNKGVVGMVELERECVVLNVD